MEQEYLNLFSKLSNSDSTIRTNAEETFKQQQISDSTIALSLLNITLNQNCAEPARQQAVVLLRRYVSNNWPGIGDKCITQISPDVKQRVRQELFRGFDDQSSKIRNGIAYCISTIAGQDWPQEWPDFCNLLEQGLKNPASLNASLKVLVEFSTDISIEHLKIFVQTFFQPLAMLIMSPDCSFINKMHAFTIFQSCFQLSSECDETSKKLMASNIQATLDLIKSALATKSSNTFEYYGYIASSVQLMTLLLMYFSKESRNDLPAILTSIWKRFCETADVYTTAYIESVDSSLELDSELEDGEKIGISPFLNDCIQFIVEVQTKKRGRKLIEGELPEIMFKLIALSQITGDQLETWEDDLEVFQEEETMSGYGASSIRAAAQEALSEQMPTEYTNPSMFIEKIWKASEIAIERFKGTWQICEAVSLTLVSLSGLIGNEENAKDICKKEFDQFVSSIVLPKVKNFENKWLTGRLLIFSGKYSQKLEPELTAQLLETTTNFLQQDNIHSKILAIRALHGMVDNLMVSNRQKELEATLDRNVTAVLQLASKSFGSEILNSCLEILHSLLEINKEITSKHAPVCTEMLCLLLTHNTTDPLLAEDVLEVMDQLLASKSIADQVVSQMTPVLSGILTNQIKPDGDSDSNFTLVATAIEAVEHVAKSSRNNDMSVSEEQFSKFLQAVYIPALLQTAKPNADSALIHNAVDASKAVFTTEYGPKLLLNLRHEDKSYIEYTLQLISVVLSPTVDESAALNIGKLITLLVSKCGQELQQNNLLDSLLTAVLNKLKSAETLSVQQSLLLVFGQLMCENINAVITFLSSMNAIEPVLSLFTEKYPDFFGFLERKVGIVSLANLLKYAVAYSDQCLLNMQVKGEEIVTEKRQTRSATKLNPKRYTALPLPIKLYKILLNEVQVQMDKTMRIEKSTYSSESDYDDAYSDEEEGLDHSFEDFINGGMGFIDDDDEFFDANELKDNPVSNVDIIEHVSVILKAIPHNEQIGQALNDLERATAQSLGISY